MVFRLMVFLTFYVQNVSAQVFDYRNDKISFRMSACIKRNDSLNVSVSINNISIENILLSTTNGNYMFMGNNSTLYLYMGWDQEYADGNLQMKVIRPNEVFTFNKILMNVPVNSIHMMLNYVPSAKYGYIQNNEVVMLGISHLINGIWHEFDLNLTDSKNLPNCID